MVLIERYEFYFAGINSGFAIVSTVWLAPKFRWDTGLYVPSTLTITSLFRPHSSNIKQKVKLS